MSDKDYDFTNEIEEANWDMIEPHFTRGAVFLISDNLDLASVAKAMGKDEVEKVETWLKDSDITRPSPEQIQQWEADSKTKRFKFVIVQPYVIIALKTVTLQ